MKSCSTTKKMFMMMHLNREIKIWWPRNDQVLFHLVGVLEKDTCH